MPKSGGNGLSFNKSISFDGFESIENGPKTESSSVYEFLINRGNYQSQ